MGNIQILNCVADGEILKKGAEVMRLEGNLYEILTIERTMLNIMMRMSSIASTTYKFATRIKEVSNSVKIAATRKTTPGFRIFEKRAVVIGGKGNSDTHRWSLDDMVLLKDTHLAAFNHNIAELITTAKKTTSFSKKIEIEVQTNEDALIAAQSGADIIMFDNMIPVEIKSAIKIITKTLGKSKLPIFEASGNITLNNVSEYATSGVDIISTSQITFHPQQKIDISLEILPN
jgi:nicotinate-nucleotide pyrophosphorylase (carboxylating)